MTLALASSSASYCEPGSSGVNALVGLIIVSPDVDVKTQKSRGNHGFVL